jgi:hypothetical protein
MHILEFENYEVRPTEEAFMIRPIRKLYNSDRSKGKEKFLQMMAVLYFLTDPRSTYNYILDDEDRLKAIIEQEGLPSNFKIDGDLQEAIECYQKHCITTSSLLLQDTKIVIDKMRQTLKGIDFTEMEEKDKVNAVKTVASITAMLPKIIKDVNEAEKAVNSDLEEVGRARGGNESKSLLEDNIALY